MVSASTNSTPEASVVATTTPTASLVTEQRLGRRSRHGRSARAGRQRGGNPVAALTRTRSVCLDCAPQFQKRFR
jgi:hypothetical protein